MLFIFIRKALCKQCWKKASGGFPEKLFITFQTLDRLVVDVRDVQNCRQEATIFSLLPRKLAFEPLLYTA